MEWATQDEQLGSGGETASYEAPPAAPVPPAARSTQDTMAMAPAPATAVPASPSLSSGSEQCQNCGAHVAQDQRYCLNCGQRRGDPRLPIMDASAFMETSMQQRRPQAGTPAPPKKSRMSPNASLIAGVGTLLLAMGVGVLIGHSGSHSGSTATAPPVQVVTAPSSGAAAGAAATKTASSDTGGSSTKTSKAATASHSSSSQAANSVLKPTAKAGKLPPANVGVGDPGKGRGYKNGKFTGDFFGP